MRAFQLLVALIITALLSGAFTVSSTLREAAEAAAIGQNNDKSGPVQVGGRIAKDTVWTGNVLVTDDVIVGRDEKYNPATLTIQNATVRFARRSALVVRTRVVAKNSTFTSAEDKPEPGNWRGVLVEPLPLAYLPAAPSASEFSDCTIEYAHTGLEVNYRRAPTAVTVAHSQVRKCRWGGIVMEGVSGGKVTGNQISEICLGGPSEEGRGLGFLNSKDCTVLGNTIRNCSDSGISLDRCQGFEIRGNRTENITGGPHGAYALWGLGIAMLDSDDNRVLDNTFLNTAYMAIWIAYGSYRNLVQGNRVENALDGIAFTGAADLNQCRRNTFQGGAWSVLYVCGPDRMSFEGCAIEDANGGACFTARTGQPTFLDCDWTNSGGMNFWGDSKVTVVRCRLKKHQGDYAVNLQNQSHGTMTDCEFDKNAMTVAPDSTGSIEVKYTLTLKAVDGQTGGDLPRFNVFVRPAGDSAKEEVAAQEPGKLCQLALTEFVFDKSGKHYRAPYGVRIEAKGYQTAVLKLPMDKPTQHTVRLARSRVIAHPAPPGEPASQDYEVRVNGQPVFCYTSYRFDTDSKTTIAGRPVSPVSFCSFDHDGEVEVEVRLLDGLHRAGLDTSSVLVRPLARGIQPRVKDGRFRFRLRRPCQLSIEPGGSLVHPLHLFANPPEKNAPDPKDPKVRYYGPGYHEAGEIDLLSGETVYIAGGAIVSLKPQPTEKLVADHRHQNHGVDVWWTPGLFGSNGKKQVTVRGRGILCGRKALEHHQRGALIRAEGIEDLTIEGIILRECPVWSMYVTNCRRVRISNVKIVGHYVNNDGIPIAGTSEAVVEDCFLHNADDSLEVKVWIPQRDVTFRRCVVWNDVGGSLGLMHESEGGIENVAFENCTVIHSTDDMSVCPVAGLKLTGPGSARNFRFENITIEDVRGPHRPALKVINNWDDWHLNYPTKPGSPYELLAPPKRERSSGPIRDVLFRNVQVLQCRNTDVVIIADGPDSPIENVIFENVVIAGKRLVPGDPRIKTNAWVKGVVVK